MSYGLLCLLGQSSIDGVFESGYYFVWFLSSEDGGPSDDNVTS